MQSLTKVIAARNGGKEGNKELIEWYRRLEQQSGMTLHSENEAENNASSFIESARQLSQSQKDEQAQNKRIQARRAKNKEREKRNGEG